MSTILLLEDDPLFRRLVLEVLERRGHQVLEAGDGAEANELLSRQKVDLVIVDGNLPDTNGIAWIRAFRLSDRGTPVLFVSSEWRDLESFHVLTRELGVGLVVHKPVIPAVFGEQVESQLDDIGAPRSGPLDESDPEMAALRSDYAKRLPEKVSALAVAMATLRKSPTSVPAWETAESLAHKLRGTSGSYGFHELAGVIGHVEDVLHAARGKDAEVRDDAFADLPGVISAAEQAADRALRSSANESIRPFTLTSSTALVVDGDRPFLDLIVEMGRLQLVEVMAASSAVEALALAKKRPPDVALLELDEGGSSLARDLRALPGCEALPLAFVSEGSDIDARVAAAHAGASLFLPKPIDADALGAALRHLLAVRETWRPHILVLDDDGAFASRIALLLRQHQMQATTLEDPHRILDVLDEIRPDLLLLDVMLPGVSGFDICRMLRTTPAWQHLPVLFLTAKTELESRVAAFQAGADDYLAKPIVAEELLARVQVRVERSRLLRERTNRDALTGLLLRAPFLERVSVMLSHAARHDRPLTICLLDLDLFKSVNDVHGHLAGDRVLAGLGKLLVGRFRAEDVRARWGGEEFVLAFEGEPAETIRHVLTRVLGEFSAIQFQGDEGEPFTESFSGGVATFPQDGATLHELLRVADRRLYLGKDAGRARVIAVG